MKRTRIRQHSAQRNLRPDLAVHLVFVDPDGTIQVDKHLTPIDLAGNPITSDDLIPLPDGAPIAMMPGRLAVGLNAAGHTIVLPASDGWCSSAFLPIGYTRTCIPGYQLAPEYQIPAGAETLPFFGYTAIVEYSNAIYAAAIQTDIADQWHPDAFEPHHLERRVKALLRQFPENRALQQHAHCALDYHCPTASNLFLQRWEGAIAVSGGCNARCIGCISKQEEEGLVSPQDRLNFVPTIDEIVEIGAAHLLTQPEAIISFGQGCEGEPLLQHRTLEKAIRGMRERTRQGTININTNASNPQAIARLCAAGLDTMRASTISARPATYTAYYRPSGYTFDHVKRSLIVAREAGIFTSINLLLFPGIADAEDEAAAWVDFLRETGTQLVQLRNLNIDPELVLPKLPPRGKPIGVRSFISLLQRELPDLQIGNFSLPVRRNELGIRIPLYNKMPLSSLR